jgi:secreted trypsin-like serine protease
MNKLKIILTLALIFGTIPGSAVAMENAPDAINDKRTVPVMSEGPWKVCTGFLYSSRIVLTAGHCLFNIKTKKPYEKMYIGLPGKAYSKENYKILVEKTFYSDNWSFRGPDDFTDKDDFGILILKESVPIVGSTVVANENQILKYLDNKIMISTVGYGRQNAAHDHNDLTTPKYAEFPLLSFDIVDQELQKVWNYYGKKKYYGMKIHILQTPNGPSTCGGDSGSPFYVKEGNNFVYLGPLSWGVGGIPNCSGNGWITNQMYMGSVAAYDYLYLIKEAENYVARQNVAITPTPIASSLPKKPTIKITIKCYKGKEIKKIYGINPKCPKGYKVRV